MGIILVSLSLLACSNSGDGGDPAAAPAAAAPTPPIEASTAAATPSAGAAPVATIVPVLSGQALIEALRRGGYVIAFRHALTDMTQSDREPLDLTDCAAQRNLNQAGRDQARAIGAEFTRLLIPRTRTLTSPYCRTRETAELAFGAFEINGALEQQVSRDAAATAAVMNSLLSSLPPPGQNTIMVTHSTNLTVVGLPVIGEGDSIVLRPSGTAWMPIALVRAVDWTQLP